jgi:hypothetical protein
MTTVRIYQPSKSAMQSGKGNTREWLVEFEKWDPLLPEPLNGWVSSKDTKQQLQLKFQTLEEALTFVNSKGLKYTVLNPALQEMFPKSYGFNFTCPRIRGF